MRRVDLIKWIEELRSGRWKQIRGSYQGDHYRERCAIGVAMSLGLSNIVDDDYIYPSTITRNDKMNHSFDQIASWLEEDVLTNKELVYD